MTRRLDSRLGGCRTLRHGARGAGTPRGHRGLQFALAEHVRLLLIKTRALDDVAQLTDIAGPLRGLQQPLGGSGHADDRPIDRAESTHE